MYLAHYGLTLKPFSISPDPRFLWLGERHGEALATLRYGIQENKGFLLLTGDVGTGKTVIINHLTELINVEVLAATIPDPNLGLIDFYNILTEEFKMGRQVKSKGEFLIHFKKFLIEACGDEKSVLLIIDEAQRLEHELLEEIRLLSNIVFHSGKLINIFLVGQSELRKMLLDEKNRAFRQRISVNYHIEPLNEKETASFIEHRLKVAGAARRFFTADAMAEVHAFSQGFPRLINVICDHALMSGYSAGFTMIDGGIVKECADELQISADVATPPLKLPAVDESSPPAQLPETSEPLEEPETSEKNPLSIEAVIIALFIVLGIAVLFVHSPRVEQFPASTRQQNEIALAQGATKIDQESPTGIATSRGDNKDARVSKPLAEKLPTDKNSESINVAQGEPNNEVKEIKTDKISQSQISNTHSKGKKFSEEKKLISDNDADFTAVAIEQSAGPEGEQQSMVPLERKFLIYFKRDSTELDSRHFETLTKITGHLSRDSNAEIIIEGYTDSYGNYFYNKKLSQLRANIIESYIVSQGVAKSRIKAIGMGPENPIADNATQDGRSKNRRVEIRVKFGNHGEILN